MSAASIKQEIAALRAKLEALEARVEASLVEDEPVPDAMEADLDTWLERNFSALEKRSLEGYEALARGECVPGTIAEHRARLFEKFRRASDT